MKRLWVVVVTAALALGCRSSQPTTNPFLRTTVPPPGTGQGAVVVPGEPYTPGAVGAPTVAPGVTTAPAVPLDPSAVPVTPPPAGAPVVAPPMTPPPVKNNKYAPPGGSYIYNQSSREPPRVRNTQLAAYPDAEGRPIEYERLADAGDDVSDGADDPIRLEDVQLEPVRDAVRLAAHRVKTDPAELVASDDPSEAIEEASRFGEPVPSHARVTKLDVPSNANTLRVVGTSSDELEPSADATPAATLRITAGGADSKSVERAQWVVKEPAR